MRHPLGPVHRALTGPDQGAALPVSKASWGRAVDQLKGLMNARVALRFWNTAVDSDDEDEGPGWYNSLGLYSIDDVLASPLYGWGRAGRAADFKGKDVTSEQLCIAADMACSALLGGSRAWDGGRRSGGLRRPSASTGLSLNP